MSFAKVAIIGAGASGVFTAIQIKEQNPNLNVTLYEATSNPLQKVRVSGGGRCNVTHNVFEEKLLVEKYPRGKRELLGPFTKFQPKHMLQWLSDKGVTIKAEPDGRMFPVTNRSETIIECFQNQLQKWNVKVQLKHSVHRICQQEDGDFYIEFKDQIPETATHLVLATGSSQKGHKLAKDLGHKITPLAPSLFTFNVKDPRITELPGVSFQDIGLTLILGKTKFKERGPLLITHWGFSGPALIRLSAWAARELQESNYQAELRIHWDPDKTEDQIRNALITVAAENKGKKIVKLPYNNLSKRYWANWMQYLEISEEKLWDQLSKKELNKLSAEIYQSSFQVTGKGIFKEEFVTCGGVSLKEINFQSMESKIVPRLYFTGEVLDIDGITGGFNFQNAWTTAYLAATAIANP